MSLKSVLSKVSMIFASFIKPRRSLLTMRRDCSAKKLSERCIMGLRRESVGWEWMIFHCLTLKRRISPSSASQEYSLFAFGVVIKAHGLELFISFVRIF